MFCRQIGHSVTELAQATHRHACAQERSTDRGASYLPVELGRGKCDNHAAATFADAGYAVANPSLAVRPYHVQNCAKRANATAAPPKLRSYTSTTEVKGRVAYVPLSDAWLF